MVSIHKFRLAPSTFHYKFSFAIISYGIATVAGVTLASICIVYSAPDLN